MPALGEEESDLAASFDLIPNKGSKKVKAALQQPSSLAEVAAQNHDAKLKKKKEKPGFMPPRKTKKQKRSEKRSAFLNKFMMPGFQAAPRGAKPVLNLNRGEVAAEAEKGSAAATLGDGTLDEALGAFDALKQDLPSVGKLAFFDPENKQLKATTTFKTEHSRKINTDSELANFTNVLKHKAFTSNPFAAIKEHLLNSAKVEFPHTQHSILKWFSKSIKLNFLVGERRGRSRAVVDYVKAG